MKLYKCCLLYLSSFCALILFITSPVFVNSAFADVPWTVVESPNRDTSYINSIDAVSANDIWAVGKSTDSDGSDGKTLIEHYDGTNWSVVESPSPGTWHNELTKVIHVSANDVWAVGFSQDFALLSETLILHWDGTSWSVVSSPNKSDIPRNLLNGITAVSANDIWAVGMAQDDFGVAYTLTLHYDGTSWSIVPSPNVGEIGNLLMAVSASSNTDVWAIGNENDDTNANITLPLVEHWDGDNWNIVETPIPAGSTDLRLLNVAAIASDNVWVVGENYTTLETFIMHYDGTDWEIVPSTTDGYLSGITAISANDIWAVGGIQATVSQPVIMHFNGTAWSVVSSPDLTTVGNGGILSSVTATATNNIWAAGSYKQGGTLFERNTTGYINPDSPLIFIPGILGSSFEVNENFETDIDNCLFGHYSYHQGELVWLSGDLSAYGKYYLCNEGRYLDVLALDEDGQTPLYGHVVTNGKPVNPYNQTITELNQLGYTPYENLFYFTYDWRKDIAGNMAALDSKINAIKASTSAQKVNIIAHSMGGLVSREYIRNASRAANVDTLVTLGTPHAGAPAALANLLYPICMKLWDAVCVIHGKELNRLAQNFTGFFELLPSKLYYQLYSQMYPYNDARDVDGNNVKGKLNYNQTKTLLTNLEKNMDLFNTAEEFHDSLDSDYSETNGVNTYRIAGSGFQTAGQIIDYEWSNSGLIKNDAIAVDGDNTVPLLSASLGPSANVYYVKQKHKDLASSDSLKMAVQLLKGQTLPIEHVQIVPFLFKGGIISVHSPVEIEAFDSDDNHTGKKSDGSFEEGIPGSSYTEIGESKYIYIPEGITYRIETKATDAGPFDLKIKTYEDDVLVKELLYLNIDQNENTTSEMIVDSDAPELNVDVNGDESEILHLSPSYIRTGDAVYDFSFPFDDEAKIAVSSQSGVINVGKPFTVDVTVNGGGEAFNAARANVSVSSNLSITGLQSPTSNACNFQYTKTPTKNDPSFAGAITGSSSNNCVVYKLIVTPNADGAGSITLSNASIKSYEDSSEILEIIQNGIYQIDAANPTPTLPPTLQPLTVTSALKTYNASFNLQGGKEATVTEVLVNGSSTGVTYPSNSTWQKTVSLVLGSNSFVLYGKDGNGHQTATKTIDVRRHTLGDINGDGTVDLIDASIFAVDWDKTQDLEDVLTDMNGDGMVNLTDLSILAKLQ